VSQYDAIAGTYDEHFGRPVDRWEDERLAALLAPLVNGRAVLDLGCGTGWLLDHCRPSYYVGVDSSVPMLTELLDKHRGTPVIKAEVGQPGWHAELDGTRFDAVTATWSLQYLGELGALLPLLAASFKPGVIALHGYLPRYRRRPHEITGQARPVMIPWQVRAATRHAGLAQPRIAGTGSLPDRFARSRAGWRVAAALTPYRWHYAALWTWRP
jgi:SAM-dependent methyltransferase